jgi:lipid-binding SYLF domain-containing protein
MKLHQLTPIIPVAIVATVGVTAPALANDHQDEVETVQEAARVLQSMLYDSDTEIPPNVFQGSEAVAIIPDVTQAGFIFGGRRGTGIMMIRQATGTWSKPAFVNVTGGSIGLQFGAKSTDLLLVFETQTALQDVIDGGDAFELGGNVTGTGGSAEETAVEATETSSVRAYSRSSGVFGGVTVEGGEFGFDDDKNAEFYGLPLVQPRDIFAGIYQGQTIDVPASARTSVREIQDLL